MDKNKLICDLKKEVEFDVSINESQQHLAHKKGPWFWATRSIYKNIVIDFRSYENYDSCEKCLFSVLNFFKLNELKISEISLYAYPEIEKPEFYDFDAGRFKERDIES